MTVKQHAKQHDVAIVLDDGGEVVDEGGIVIDTWKSYEVTIDMLSPGSAWTLELWKSETRGSTWDLLQTRAKLGAYVSVTIDGAIQLNGRIETREEHASHNGATMTISGRDNSGVAIDSDADPTIHLRGSTIGDVVDRLFSPLRIGVFIVKAAAGREVQSIAHSRAGIATKGAHRRHRVDVLKVKPGETVWQVAHRVCKNAGYLIWTAPHPSRRDGVSVVIDKPAELGAETFHFARFGQVHHHQYLNTGKVRNRTEYRGNVLTSKYSGSIRGVPTKLTAFAHTAANANDDARIRTEVPNEGLVHPLVVEPGFLLPTQRFIRGHHARTPQALRRHAERVIADAMAGFRVYECTVQGHGERINEQMTMYAVNSLAHVRDDFHRINETMLITSVDFSGSREGGQRTTLRMVPKGAIKVFPDSDGE